MEVDGASGGLMILLNPMIINISRDITLLESQRYTHALATNLEYNINFIIINIYAPNYFIERRYILSLDRMRFKYLRWIIMGDFNTILHPNEKRRSRR